MPTAEDAAMLSAYGERVELARREADRKWGFERLVMLVPVDLAAKFARQRITWSGAYREAWEAPFVSRDALALMVAKTEAMLRGYAALDAAATEAGHRPVAPWVWEVLLEDGSVAALVQTEAEASKVIAEGRFVRVYTAREIGHVIDAVPQALAMAKQVFPGAKFIGSRLPSAAPPWDVEHGDPLPFPLGDSHGGGEGAWS